MSNLSFVERPSSQRYYARQPTSDYEDGAPNTELNNPRFSNSVPGDQHLKMNFRNSTGYDGSHDDDGTYLENVNKSSRDDSNNQSRSYSARARARGGLGINTSMSGKETWQGSPLTTPTEAADRRSRDQALLDTQVRRQESVPERSPLQKLELSLVDKTKEEKRARAEHAEERARMIAAERRKSGPQQEPAHGNTRGNRYSFHDGYEKLDLGIRSNNQSDHHNSGSRTSSREYGHDANLKGGAAAAAVSAYRAGKSSYQEDTYTTYNYESAVGEAGRGFNGTSGTRRNNERAAEAQRQSREDRSGDPAVGGQEDDFYPRSEARAENVSGSTYVLPPQTAGAVRARKQVAFGNMEPQQIAVGPRANMPPMRRYQAAKNLEEWRGADTAKLTEADIQTGDGKRHQSKRQSTTEGISTHTACKPVLMLRCGPLLRYTGLRRGRLSSQGTAAAEFWSGSVMIVTDDAHSSYERTPVLRIFKQSMGARSSEPSLNTAAGAYQDVEHVDDLAGQLKMSRIGEILLVRPANQLRAGLDLSNMETSEGLFERMVSADQMRRVSARIEQNDGEKAGRYRDVKGFRLHRERGVTFWRFNIQIELTQQETRFAYRINHGPPIGFWVPAKGQNMNIMFHSDNGFDLNVNPNEFCGPDPLWRDVLRKHQQQPLHVMVGGGDQIYNDAAMQQTEHFQKWLTIQNTSRKHGAEFTPEMQDDLEEYYLNKYSQWFSQGLFGMANAQIPMVNMWNDHDIMDVSLRGIFCQAFTKHELRASAHIPTIS